MYGSQSSEIPRIILLTLALAVGYFVTGMLGLMLAIPPGYATAVWPASGFALAGLLRFGYRLWPGVFVGSFSVNLVNSFDPEAAGVLFIISIGIATGATLQALVGAYLVSRYVDLKAGLIQTQDIFKFYFHAGPASCLVSASVGVTTLWVSGSISAAEFPYSWMTWWVGDTIGVLLVVPLLLVLFGEPKSIWSQRSSRVATPVFLVLFLAVLAFVFSSQQEQDRIESEFREQAVALGNSLEKELAKYLETLYSLQNLINFSGSVDRAHFRNHTLRVLDRNSGIQALSWNPVIRGDYRNQFEEDVRQEGHSKFSINEKTKDGKLVKAKQRDKYVVVNFIEPMLDNAKAFGFDVYSDPLRKKALDLAAATGELIATSPIKLVQETDYQAGVLFFLPIYESSDIPFNQSDRLAMIRGYVVGVFRFGDLLSQALSDYSAPNLKTKLSDISDPKKSILLAAYRFGSSGKGQLVHDMEPSLPELPSNESQAEFNGQLLWNSQIQIGQKLWSIQVSSEHEYFQNHRSWVAWGMLTTALLFTTLFGLFLFVLTGHAIVDRNRSAKLAAEIEQRKQTESSLADSREKYRLAMEATKEGLWDWDILTGKVYYSPGWLKILGESSVANRYEAWRQRLHPEDEEEVLDSLNTHVAGATTHWSHEFRLRRKDGSWIWVLGRGQVVNRNSRGEALRMVGTMTDISIPKEAEAERERLHRELQQTRKMKALGQLTGGVAHDFNNILGIIMGYTNMALDRFGDQLPDKVITYLNTSIKASERAKGLVAKMLTFSRSRTEDERPLQLAPLVEENLEMLRSILPSSIQVEFDYEPDLPSVVLDPSHMQQLLMNLCLNARDAMEGSGKLSIGLGWQRNIFEECASCHRRIEGDWMELWVRDNGTGMSPDVIEHLFEPFFTTKEVGKGTGMGMAVIHGIISDHSGHILVETEVGLGSTFRILLPAAEAAEGGVGPESEESHLVHHSEAHLLVVDDEPDLAEYVADLLELHEYESTIAHDAEEALELFHKNPTRYQGVISDYTMPGMNGVELITEIRKISASFPAILCTGYSDDIDIEGAERRGIRYLSKPIESDRLLNLLAELIELAKDTTLRKSS